MRNDSPLIVNLFGGPGLGKSTTAAATFANLKLNGFNAELVTEVAKDMTWEQSQALNCQEKVYGDQLWRQHRLYGQVDCIITDSPILLGCFYTTNDLLKQLILSEFKSQNNINIVLQREKNYSRVGRSQTESEAKAIDGLILEYLKDNQIDFIYTRGMDVVNHISADICNNYL